MDLKQGECPFLPKCVHRLKKKMSQGKYELKKIKKRQESTADSKRKPFLAPEVTPEEAFLSANCNAWRESLAILPEPGTALELGHLIHRPSSVDAAVSEWSSLQP